MVLLWGLGGGLALAALLLGVHTVYRAVARARRRLPEGGIEEAGLVEINGIRQYIHIRGRDKGAPVLLVLHGGPGAPLSAMMHGFQHEWEKEYVVVQWDQRYSGKTYYANGRDVAGTLSFETVLEDAWQVVQHLQRRLGVEKVAVLGHSWGSILGTALVHRWPEAFSCYIGVGQVANMKDNERLGYEKTLELARTKGAAKDVAALKAMAGYPGEEYSPAFGRQMVALRRYQSRYGLAEVITAKNVLLVLTSPWTSFFEALYYTKNAVAMQEPLVRYMFEEFDALAYGAFAVPVYYLMGENDWQTPVPLAHKVFERIQAPKKSFTLVPGAGHFTMYDNKEAFSAVLLGEVRAAL